MRDTVTPTPFSRRQRIAAALLVLFSALCFSAKAVLAKLAYRYEIDSLSLLTLRMVFALPFFIGIGIWTRRRARSEAVSSQPASTKKPSQGAALDMTPAQSVITNGSQLTSRDFLHILALGLSGYYASSFLDFWGLTYITAGLERLILFLYPTLVLAMSALFLRQPVTRTQLMALVLTYGGVALAMLDRAQLSSGRNIPLGALLVFLSGVTYAAYLVGSSRYIVRIGSLRYTCAAMSAAALGSIVHHGIVYRWALFHYPWPVYTLSLIMALFSTVLPTFMVSEAIRIIGAGNAAIIASIGPVATLALGYLFLGEVAGPWQLVGTILVIIGVMRTSLKQA